MKIKSIREVLAEKSKALGILFMYPSCGSIEKIGGDWDWIWIDAQHGQFGYDSMMACVRAGNLVDSVPVVRVPGHEYALIGLALDTGASGVMVPMVDTVEQAREVVKAAKFAPLGKRSFGGRRAIDLYGRGHVHTANEDIILIAQIETNEGVSNVEKIAALSGIDALFFGPDDMSMQRGLRMDKPRKADYFKPEMEKVAKAALKEKKIAGTVATTPELLKMAIDMGYKLICIGADAGILASASKELKERLV